MFKGWWIVGTHFVVLFFTVGFYQYGLPLLVPHVIEHYDTDAATINWLFTVHVALGLIVAPVAGPLVDRWSARGLLLIGVLLFASGVAILGIAPNAWIFVLGGGLGLGISGSLCGPMTGSAVISRFFTTTRGRALGLTAIGTSVGGFVVPALIAAGVAGIGWQNTVLAVAAVTLLVSIPLLGLRFWNSPEAAGVEMEPAPEGAADQSDDRAAMTTREILGQLSFWLFSISLALFIAVFTSTVFNLGLHFADRGLESSQASTLMQLVAVGGILGKLGFGEIGDRIALKLAFIVAIGVTASALGMLLTEPGYPVLLATMLLLGIATGGLLPVWNAMVPRLFGVANFGRTMGLMGPVISLTTMSVYPLVGSVRDATGSYSAVFQADLVALAVAVAVVIPLREGRK